MTLVHQSLLLAGKDLRLAGRTRQSTALVCVLGVLIIVVLSLGLGPAGAADGARAASVLWTAYLFGGILCFDRTTRTEHADGAVDALRLSPADPAALFLGKLLTNLVLMSVLCSVVTLAGSLLFHLDISSAPLAFVSIMGLSVVGLAAIGTLFSASTSALGLGSEMLAIIVLPLALPLVLASSRLLERAMSSHEPGAAAPLSGIGVLVAFDVIYLVAGWLAFGLALEE